MWVFYQAGLEQSEVTLLRRIVDFFVENRVFSVGEAGRTHLFFDFWRVKHDLRA